MNKAPAITLFGAAFFLIGCAGKTSLEYGDAVLLNPSPQTRTEISNVISEALGGRRVKIGPESFVESNLLIIDTEQARFADGYTIYGRDRARPNHFHLKMSKGGCSIFHEETGQFFSLSLSKCRLVTNLE